MATIHTLDLSISGESNPNPPPESDPLANQNPNEGKEPAEEIMGEQAHVTEVVGLVSGGTSGDSTPVPEKRGYELAVVKTPDWLPAGWSTEIKVRSSGVTAGTRDRYFYDPVSNRKFRTKKEVFSFLQTGKLGRYKPKQKIDESYANSTGKSSTTLHPSSNTGRQASSGSSPQRPLRFDFVNPPPKVRWVFNGSEGSWSPFIGDEELPESSKRMWVAALELHTDVLNSFHE